MIRLRLRTTIFSQSGVLFFSLLPASAVACESEVDRDTVRSSDATNGCEWKTKGLLMGDPLSFVQISILLGASANLTATYL